MQAQREELEVSDAVCESPGVARWDAHLLGINITKSCSLKKACCSAWAVLQQPADALDPRHHGKLVLELLGCRGVERC